MTKDLAALYDGDTRAVTSREFLKEIQEMMKKKIRNT